jgi:hypothetical protein
MTENSNRATAQIYQFPIGGRSGLAVRRDTSKPAAEHNMEATNKVAIGGNWYHEEAVREADRSLRH